MSELKTAIDAARHAGQALREHYNTPHHVSFKGIIDLVTEMDTLSEKMVVDILRKAFPDYGVLGEEGSKSTEPYTCRWIIDPLDGTTNYSHNYPLFAVSIALEKMGEITLGAVYNPILDELFTAEKGGGAYLNGNPIHVTETTLLGKSLLASGFPYDVRSSPINNFREWEQFMKSALTVRCDGSAALDLCHTACGRLDGFWESGLAPWDMAAGALIVQEAGGIVTQTNGNLFNHLVGSVLASNGLLHQQMLEVMKK
jgi:myo-inositol-1(or 4)-monophosphatase